ncbi:hypothetical protein WN944_014412 [Citrus x changshan-huyou]|uniref:Uncharacterized protein n=1 Tax=Citrus x changshan-huyou TaxID=2935761 RepID=A0AAP0M5R6_9ROSI
MHFSLDLSFLITCISLNIHQTPSHSPSRTHRESWVFLRQQDNDNNNNPDDEAAAAPRVEEVDEFTHDVEGNSMQNGTRH